MKVTISMELQDGGRACVVELVRRLGKIMSHVLRHGRVESLWLRDEEGETLADVSIEVELEHRLCVSPTGEALCAFHKRQRAREAGLSGEWTMPLPVWRKE